MGETNSVDLKIAQGPKEDVTLARKLARHPREWGMDGNLSPLLQRESNFGARPGRSRRIAPSRKTGDNVRTWLERPKRQPVHRERLRTSTAFEGARHARPARQGTLESQPSLPISFRGRARAFTNVWGRLFKNASGPVGPNRISTRRGQSRPVAPTGPTGLNRISTVRARAGRIVSVLFGPRGQKRASTRSGPDGQPNLAKPRRAQMDPSYLLSFAKLASLSRFRAVQTSSF